MSDYTVDAEAPIRYEEEEEFYVCLLLHQREHIKIPNEYLGISLKQMLDFRFLCTQILDPT